MQISRKRQLKNLAKRLMRRIFELGQQFNQDILPRHFYSEIPDMRTLRNSKQWQFPRSLFEIRGDIDDQVKWVDICTKNYRDKLRDFKIHDSAVGLNGSDEGYGQVETDFLYCFIRAYRPRRIVQVGCGVSTAVCLIAARDEGYTPQITCVEPYPTEFLKREEELGKINLLPKRFEDVGPTCVSSLEAGDLFFVDSSHTLAPAGEVNLIILETLPRLASRTYVHFHDIHFPYDYSPDTLSTALFFPHETALLYAFLLMNDRFEIAASLSMIHHMRVNDLVRFFPSMKPKNFHEGLAIGSEGQYPSSIFLHRT